MRDRLRNDSSFKAIAPILKPIGLTLVDVRRDELSSSVRYTITITNEDHTAGIDECSKAHRLLQTRLTLLENDRDIDMEVSTPGIQRNIRDVYEFEVFTSRRCRIYESDENGWIVGIIESADEHQVTLAQAEREDNKEKIGTHQIPYSRIQKAKLTYAWEDIS
ncbi:MAG: ribosome assembly cofactor RimP [Sphaerochaetaceae bacterium]|nr:ribosome assembly cofactor RimP [Sphaerochaetaceae bacterium]